MFESARVANRGRRAHRIGCRRGARRGADRGAARRACHRVGIGRRRRRVRQGESREQATLPLLGRGLVPAVQRSEGDDLHPPGFHRALAQFRPRLHGRRRAGRAKAGRALQRERLPDDGAVHAGRQRDHALARRSRARPVHAGARPRHERGAAGEGHARLALAAGSRGARGGCGRKTGECSRGTRGTPTKAQVLPARQPAGHARAARQRVPRHGTASSRRRLALQAMRSPPRVRARRRTTTAPGSISCFRCSPIARSRARISILLSITPTTLSATSRCRNPQNAPGLVEAWNAALDRVAADPGLSELDRLAALNAEVVLAKLDSAKGPVPDALHKRLRAKPARADRDHRRIRIRGSR